MQVPTSPNSVVRAPGMACDTAGAPRFYSRPNSPGPGSASSTFRTGGSAVAPGLRKVGSAGVVPPSAKHGSAISPVAGRRPASTASSAISRQASAQATQGGLLPWLKYRSPASQPMSPQQSVLPDGPQSLPTSAPMSPKMGSLVVPTGGMRQSQATSRESSNERGAARGTPIYAMPQVSDSPSSSLKLEAVLEESQSRQAPGRGFSPRRLVPAPMVAGSQGSSVEARLEAEVAALRDELEAQRTTLTELAKRVLGSDAALAPSTEAARMRQVAAMEASVADVKRALRAMQEEHDLAAGALREGLLEIHMHKDASKAASSAVDIEAMRGLLDDLTAQVASEIATRQRDFDELRASLKRLPSTRDAGDGSVEDSNASETLVGRIELLERELRKASEGARGQTGVTPETRTIINATVQACETVLKEEIGRSMRSVQEEVRASVNAVGPLADRIRHVEAMLAQQGKASMSPGSSLTHAGKPRLSTSPVGSVGVSPVKPRAPQTSPVLMP